MSTLTLDTRIRQHPDQIATEVDGEVLMMHIESGNYFGLNEVASFLWNQLDTPRTVAALCVAVQTEFKVDEERCQADTLAFLEDMISDGLVEVVAPDSSNHATA